MDGFLWWMLLALGCVKYTEAIAQLSLVTLAPSLPDKKGYVTRSSETNRWFTHVAELKTHQQYSLFPMGLKRNSRR